MIWMRCLLASAIVALMPAVVLASGIDDTFYLTNNAALSFGDLAVGAVGGTVTIDPAGVRTTVGVTGLGSAGYGAAQFTILIPAQNPNYTILQPPNTQLTGPGAPMAVDTFTSNPTFGGHTSHGVPESIFIGATLHVGANQAAGSYSGTFLLTVTNP
jgi:Domain of unknown function (DUF4402)